MHLPMARPCSGGRSGGQQALPPGPNRVGQVGGTYQRRTSSLAQGDPPAIPSNPEARTILLFGSCHRSLKHTNQETYMFNIDNMTIGQQKQSTLRPVRQPVNRKAGQSLKLTALEGDAHTVDTPDFPSDRGLG